MTRSDLFNKSRTILIIAVLLIGTLYLLSLSSNQELPTLIYSYFTFDPETILESITARKTDLFSLQPDNFEPVLATGRPAVYWDEGEFIKVIEALHQQIWNEPLNQWKIHMMFYKVDCAQAGSGFEQATLEFYKLTKVFPLKKGYDETITINLSTNSIWVKTGPLSPSKTYSQSIQLPQLGVNADQVLDIVEDFKGREVRSRIENNCGISILLAPDGQAQNWSVQYLNQGVSPFEAIVDLQTGEVIR